MRRWLISLLTLHFLWGVLGIGFGLQLDQPTDFYSIDIAQEQLRSDADNRLDDQIESLLTQHALMDELPDVPYAPFQEALLLTPSPSPTERIAYREIFHRVPAPESLLRPPCLT